MPKPKTAHDDLLAACKAQHDAIDILFAVIIAGTKPGQEPFYPSESGRPWAALQQGLKAITAAENEPTAPSETLYTFAQLEAAACMWEYVVRELRRHREARNPWEEYRDAYGTVPLRVAVIQHAPELYTAYEAALENGYEKDFDRDFIPQYMENHVTRILT